LLKFERAHPAHVKPRSGGEPFEVKAHESPTTDHIRVQCGCGYIERYTLISL
jgi:RNase P subunit RPR2